MLSLMNISQVAIRCNESFRTTYTHSPNILISAPDVSTSQNVVRGETGAVTLITKRTNARVTVFTTSKVTALLIILT